MIKHLTLNKKETITHMCISHSVIQTTGEVRDILDVLRSVALSI